MKKKLPAALFLFAFLAASGYALDLQEALSILMDKALAVHITARVMENGKQTIWNMDISQVTISGKAVTVNLNGNNIVVTAQFTPYKESGNQVLLVAQGQTWITSPVDKKVKYATSFKSLPIDLGEPVLFYPLGVNLQTEKYGNVYIELEIRVVPYADDLVAAKQQNEKGSSGSPSPSDSSSGSGTQSGPSSNGGSTTGGAANGSGNSGTSAGTSGAGSNSGATGSSGAGSSPDSAQTSTGTGRAPSPSTSSTTNR